MIRPSILTRVGLALLRRLLPALSFPESPDATRMLDGRPPTRDVVALLTPARAAPSRGWVVPVMRPAVVEVVDRRPPRDDGTAGGPIDVRVPPTDARGRDVTEESRPPPPVPALDGVPVREVAVLDGPVASCFVGDFVGDYIMLDPN